MWDGTRAQSIDVDKEHLEDVKALYPITVGQSVDDNADVMEEHAFMRDMRGLFKRTHSIDVDNEEQDIMNPRNNDYWVSEELMGYILLRHL